MSRKSISIHHSAIPAETIAAYRSTHYKVFPRAKEFTLLVDQYSDELRALMQHHAVHEAALISACNPLGELARADQNAAAHARLLQQLDDEKLQWIHALACDPTTTQWPAEEGVLIMGIGLDAACRVANAFMQNALLHVEADAVPRLILLR
jgi:hypothetical protein